MPSGQIAAAFAAANFSASPSLSLRTTCARASSRAATKSPQVPMPAPRSSTRRGVPLRPHKLALAKNRQSRRLAAGHEAQPVPSARPPSSSSSSLRRPLGESGGTYADRVHRLRNFISACPGTSRRHIGVAEAICSSLECRVLNSTAAFLSQELVGKMRSGQEAYEGRCRACTFCVVLSKDLFSTWPPH